MAATVEIIIKTIDQSSKELKKTGDNLKKFQDNIENLAKGLAVMGVAAVGAFKAFERGAKVEQTAQSFDFLIQKIGAAPDLLNQLDQAANGTISRMELMASTSILLAGAQGTLATNLALATPQLLEIAKAANKLNPSLGTTSFLYESLGRGIKRSSPLILDNLGLVVKIGEANEKYAEKLGKSVNELTAAEKQQALLNATLEAGGVLIEQVGGDVDSLTDSTQKLSAGWKNFMDAILADSASEGKFFGNLGDNLSNLGLLIDEFGAGRVIGASLAPGGETTEDLIRAFNKAQAARERLGDDISVGDMFEDFQAFDPKEISAIEEQLEEANIEVPITPVFDTFDDIQLDLASPIEKALAEIDFIQAGGDVLQQTIEDVISARDTGAIGIGAAEALLQELEAQAKLFAAGKEFDVTGVQADLQTAEDFVDKKEFMELREIPPATEFLGSIEAAAKIAEELTSNIESLDGKNITINVQLSPGILAQILQEAGVE